jgi:hypothetical protein
MNVGRVTLLKVSEGYAVIDRDGGGQFVFRPKHLRRGVGLGFNAGLMDTVVEFEVGPTAEFKHARGRATALDVRPAGIGDEQ